MQAHYPKTFTYAIRNAWTPWPSRVRKMPPAAPLYRQREDMAKEPGRGFCKRNNQTQPKGQIRRNRYNANSSKYRCSFTLRPGEILQIYFCPVMGTSHTHTCPRTRLHCPASRIPVATSGSTCRERLKLFPQHSLGIMESS